MSLTFSCTYVSEPTTWHVGLDLNLVAVSRA